MKTLASLVAPCAVAAALLAPASAQAKAPIYEYHISPSTHQAGGHPDLTVSFWVGNRSTQIIPAPTCDCDDPKDLIFHVPTGIIGDPHAAPQCTSADFSTFKCPTDSQVGIIKIGIAAETPKTPTSFAFGVPIYNLVPHTGQAGLLGMNLPLLYSPLFEVISPRTESDYGLDVEVLGIEHFIPLALSTQTLWGVPASEEHFGERLPIGCEPLFGEGCEPNVHSTAPEKPFLSNPTTCGVPLSSTMESVAYDLGVDTAEASYPATNGCGQLSFNPSMFAQPTTDATDSASGLNVDLQVPQTQSPTVPSPSELKGNVLTLPEGLTLNANAADGKVACTDTEAHFGSRDAAQCPENSKVGTLTLTSAALPGPLPGYIYIGQPLPGERFRIFLVADGFNVHVKLAGVIKPDPQTGRLTIHFENLPQAPFSDLNLHFFGSERGALATSTQCGTYSVNSIFTPWDEFLPPQSSSQFFSIDAGPNGSNCPGATRPFAPKLSAGVVDKTAGAHTTFLINFSREDGDQNLHSVSTSTPPGFAATLAGIPYCSESAMAQAANPNRSGAQEQAEPSCPSASQVGTVVAGIGAGSHPFYTPGKVYLAGPYKGAPLSLDVIIPAVSGPYDLGNVVDRVALRVDPTDAHISAVADPFPQIIEGVPLRTRSVLLQLDRQDFALNPTNCDASSVQATLTGDQGGEANFAPHFQVANCATLPFAPQLDLSFSGGMKRVQDPAIHATLTAKGGEANISSTAVTLPPAQIIDNRHIGNPCTKVQFNEGTTPGEKCPPSSLIGTARAVTPLLGDPLEGPVYLRSAPENKSGLPDVVPVLRGQVEVVLDGKVDTVHYKVDGKSVSRIRTSFSSVPDVPVSKFQLNLKGGSRGLLQNTAPLCAATQRATVEMGGQNGKSTSRNSTVALPCSARHKRHRSHTNNGQRAANQ